MWDQSRHALEFFSLNNVPFWDMSNDNSIVSNGWALVQSSEDNVVVYLPDGTANIDLSSGTYSVSWYDPRNGGALQSGSIATLNAGNNLSIGTAPNNQNKDWVILLQRSSQPTAPTPTVPAPTPTAPTTTVPASSPPTPSPASPLVGSITGFVLIDAATDIDIGPLNPDDTVNLAVTGTQLSIRADSSGSIGSVGFALDNSASFQTENFAVYALGGNSGSNYYAVNELVQPGLHTVTATPYSGKGKSGTIGTPVSITFVVV